MEMQRWPSSLSSQNVGLRGVKREGELLSDSDSCITQYVNTAGFAGHYTLDISPGLVVLISLPFPFCESFKSLELPCTLDTLPVLAVAVSTGACAIMSVCFAYFLSH